MRACVHTHKYIQLDIPRIKNVFNSIECVLTSHIHGRFLLQSKIIFVIFPFRKYICFANSRFRFSSSKSFKSISARRRIFAETLEKNPLSVRQISPKTPQHNFLVRYYVYWRSRRRECAIRWSRSVAKRTNPLDLAQNTWLRPPPFRIIRCSEFDDAARQILFPKNPQ